MSAPSTAPPGSPPRKKRHGCLIGCLIVILVPLLLCGGVSAYTALRPSPADELLSGPPDPDVAAAIVADMQARGIPTDSLTVYVYPMTDGSGAIAYAKVDLSKASAETGKPMPDYFVALGASQAARNAGVVQAALEIVDESGAMLVLSTTDAASCAAYADGLLDYDEFLGTLSGRVGTGVVTTWVAE